MKLFKLLILVFLGACSSPDPFVQRVIELRAFDVGNEENSADIRVTFEFEGIGQINEVRIMVIPSGLHNGFTKNQALKLSSESYFSFLVTSTDLVYSIRLSEISDVEGNPIINSKAYVIKLLMLGDRFNQLSILESNEITLSEMGIWNGNYIGVITGITTCQGDCPISLPPTITANFTGTGDDYSGTIRIGNFEELCANHKDQSSVTFVARNDSILDFSVSKSIITLCLEQHDANNWPELSERIEGKGVVKGDLFFELTAFSSFYPDRKILLRREP